MIIRLFKDIKIHKNGMLVCLLILPVMFALGVLVISLVLSLDDTASRWFCLGTIFALAAMIGIGFLYFITYSQEFMLALSMGQTRGDFMITYALRQIIWLATAYSFVLGLHQLEQMFYTAFFPETEQSLTLSFLTDWKLVVAVIPCLALLSMFLGALYSRFGKKFAAILYFSLLGSCLLGPRAVSHYGAYLRSIYQAAQVMPGRIAAVGIAVVLAMLATVIHLGMKQMVR